MGSTFILFPSREGFLRGSSHCLVGMADPFPPRNMSAALCCQLYLETPEAQQSRIFRSQGLIVIEFDFCSFLSSRSVERNCFDRPGGVAHLVEYLPSIHDALESINNTL